MACLQLNPMAFREIALSFDDGPTPDHTPKLLDILARHKVKAIFFLIGNKLATRTGKDLLRRISAEGHFIGNHTYTHADLTKLTHRQIRNELTTTASLIGDADRGIRLFRPPYGAHNLLVDQIARDLGYQMLFWNVDTQDWQPGLGTNDWVRRTLREIDAQQHSVILAHDTQVATIAKMDEFIREMERISGVHPSVTEDSLKTHLANVQPLWGVGPSAWLTARCILQELYRAILPLSLPWPKHGS